MGAWTRKAVELTKKDERQQIIHQVCRVQSVVHDVTLRVDQLPIPTILLPKMPFSDGDALHDPRVIKYLCNSGLQELCRGFWSFSIQDEDAIRIKNLTVNIYDQVRISIKKFILFDGFIPRLVRLIKHQL